MVAIGRGRARTRPRIASLRERLEAAIQRAIELLDQLDGDPDNEPSLSASSAIWQGAWAQGEGDDRELDGADDEPSLGWQIGVDQSRLDMQTDDLEDQCEDEGGQCDDEGFQDHDGPGLFLQHYPLGSGA